MALSTAQRSLIEYRRERVASLRLRGLTEREIAEALPRLGIVNPQTGKPYSDVTVHNDLQVLEERWRAEAVRERAVHKANMLAEIREARREAWKAKDLVMVDRLMQREINLLGLDEPLQMHVEQNVQVVTDARERLAHLITQYAARAGAVADTERAN
ncbi:MAG TPA: hypothetical protein PKI52_15000 [Aggregatilineales bacterium]|nr:hypothetical protein [Aggregatilineales bacterium]